MSATRETLAAPSQALLEVKKSRHLARAAPVDSPEAAMAFVAGIAREPATHHCWAWRIGQACRFNDDGEPAGTAGKPILAAIDGQGLDHVVVVVTRWYGGIKLGAGGLVRAYGGAAAEALRLGPRAPLLSLERIAVRVGFAHAQVLHALLVEFGARKASERFDAEGHCIELDLPAGSVDALEARLLDASRGLSRVFRER